MFSVLDGELRHANRSECARDRNQATTIYPILALAVDSPRVQTPKARCFQALPTFGALCWAKRTKIGKRAILIGFYVGARLSDAVSMTWDQVDLSEGMIRYVQGRLAREWKSHFTQN